MAASVWSLLIPSMEMAGSGRWSVVPATVGFLLGMGFLLMIDELTPHLHIGTDKPEGMRSHLSKTAMLALAVTIDGLTANDDGLYSMTDLDARIAEAMAEYDAIEDIPTIRK